MKNTIKLSLVAAVAVAGLTTTASAGSLESAIKDTTLKGQVTVGYQNNNYKADSQTDTNQWEYDVDATFTTKVNDTVTSTVGFQADNDITVNNEGTDTNAKGSAGVSLTKAYFTVKTSAATAMVGKQKVGTPFFDDERGDGVVALVPAGPVTIAAAHFTGINSSAVYTAPATHATGAFTRVDVNALAVLGKFGPASVAAWYVNANVADAYSVNVKAKVGPASVELNHASAELDAAGSESETLTKLVASVKAGPATIVAAYARTNDTTNRVHGVDLTDDNDAKNNFAGKIIELDTLDDASAYLIGASAKVAGATVGAHYVKASADVNAGTADDIDASELAITATYAMSKNFSINAYMAKYSQDVNGLATATAEQTESQINLSYKF